METKTCEKCGTPFEKNPATKAGTWAKQRFCSRECRNFVADRKRSTTGKTRAEILEGFRLDREEFVMDVKLLLSSENPEGIERRMGTTCPKIREKLRKMGRGDLADQLLAQEERYQIVKPGCFGPPTL